MSRVSAPASRDSIMLPRRVLKGVHTKKGIPILNLVLDSQSGAAGVETRLESFIDIIRFKEGLL